MEEIKEVIQDYLNNKKTDYAILINGQWGSGKTHYWKEEISSLISNSIYGKIENSSNKSRFWSNRSKENKPQIEIKRYEPIYLSLFGLSDIKELGSKLFIELNPFWKKRSVKTVSNITKLIVDKSLNIIGSGLDDKDFKDIINDLSIDGNKVICLDDLERLSKDILNELFGFINLFTEHDNLKVIILCDEKVISEKFVDYHAIKEKIVRFSYEFKPDLKEIFPNLISSYKNESFQKFLIEKRNFICDLYSKASHRNIRTLKFNLELFEKIYAIIEGESKTNESYKATILDRFLYFFTTYCIEYKLESEKSKLDLLKTVSNVNLIDISSLEQDFKLHVASNNDSAEQISEPTYQEQFREKYLPYLDTRFSYYEPLANYIHNGVLDGDALLVIANEITNQLEINNKTNEVDISQKLNSIYTLDDNELLPLIEKVLKVVGEGTYQLVTYPNIFFSLLRIEHLKIHNFVVTDKIIEIFLAGINKGKSKSKYSSAFQYQIPIYEGKLEKYDKVKHAAIEANNSLKYREIELYGKTLLELMKEGEIDDAAEKISNSQYQFEPVFAFMDPKDIYNVIITLHNENKWKIYDALHLRYSYSNSSSSSKKELLFFTDFKNLLDKHIDASNTHKISIEVLKQYSALADQIIKLP